MIKKIMEFLSGVKMTVVSAVFLCFSLGFMLYGIEPLVNPALVTVLISGVPIVYKAFHKLIYCRMISSPLLITIAMVAAICIGELFAAGEVALIIAIGELLEDVTIKKARRGLGRLLSLTPTTARKILANGTDEILPLSAIHADDLLRVLPGETIPVDGIIVNGNSSINQAALTGESLPVDKGCGDEVMAGTINCFGTIEIKTLNVKNTYLQKMISLVNQAQVKKAPTQRIVDKWAAILVPSALVLAVLTYFITHEIIRAVTVLVVFCPCALVLATPTSIMAAIGQAAKHGVLIKSGAALEEMGKINIAAFDKTGTLSSGKICISDFLTAEDISTKELLKLAASVEQYSEHILAKTIVLYAKNEKIALEKVHNFQMIAGRGVYGMMNGIPLIAGNLKYILETGATIHSSFLSKIKKLQQDGKAVVVIAYNERICGVIGFCDEVRMTGKQVVNDLKALDIKSVILTGDHRASAMYFAKKADIMEVYADLLPEGKVCEIEKFLKDGNRVCMIGDGVNDAAALKTANVGIAMGGMGSDIAVEAADIALINDNISSLPYLKKLSLATIKTIKINISISMVLNFIGISLSVYGILTPVTGAIMHNLGSVLVVLNAARLYDRKL